MSALQRRVGEKYCQGLLCGCLIADLFYIYSRHGCHPHLYEEYQNVWINGQGLQADTELEDQRNSICQRI
jgi:hypothetical protein